MNESDLRPGDVFVTPTSGAWYDRFFGMGIRYVTATRDDHGNWVSAKVNHTGIYVGDGQIVEAQPRGAALSQWDKYGDSASWSTGGMGTVQLDGAVVPLDLPDEKRLALADTARSLVGTPYGFVDIAAVAFAQKRLGARVDRALPLVEQPWWVRRVEERTTLICSQLVDAAYALNDLPLFADKRLPGLVTPADIGTAFL